MAGSIPISINRFHRNHSGMLAAMFFVLLSLIALGPVLQNPTERLLVRDNRLLTVPLFNTWTLWWNSLSARQSFKGYWNAPIFFPSTEAFAFSEPQPATLVVAPVIWLGGSPVLAYNIYFLVSLVLNGFLTWLILIRRRCTPFQALIGGGMMIWLPISLRQFEVLQLVPVWPILWTWHLLDQHRRAPCLNSAAALATASIVTFASSVHHGLFGIVALAFAGWPQICSFRNQRFWLFSLFALAATSAVLFVLLEPMQTALVKPEFQRDETTVTRLSAKPLDLILPPRDALIVPVKATSFGMSPGWIKSGIALTGAFLFARRQRHRRFLVFLTLMILTSGLLALGPNLNLFGIHPWNYLARFVPGLGQVRNVFRFAYLTQMATILLCVFGVREIRIAMLGWRRKGRSSDNDKSPASSANAACAEPAARPTLIKRLGPRPISALTSGLLLLGLLETPPPENESMNVPALQDHQLWTAFVRDNTPTGKAVATLPMAIHGRDREFQVTTEWMYLGILHQKPLLDGFSGFFPKTHRDLRRMIATSGITPEVLQRFAELGAHFLLVRDSDSFSEEQSLGDPKKWSLKLAFHDPAGIKVFKIRRPID